MSYNDFFPCTKWVSIGGGVFYRPHKHWGMGVYAGEGKHINNGDRSGCLRDSPLNSFDETVSKPIVVLQRIYKKGNKELSAVLSYPNGLTFVDEYFWEIYPIKGGDIDRYFGSSAEEQMERAIKGLLK